ncbi:hypothetical protein MMC14_004359 [Varicellaria rhodocarpa]|nr:hypothetical protein [Varicellaria rhodocarpa]
MLFQSVALLAILTAAIPVIAQNISAADVVSNIDRLTTLTRIATSITQDVVLVNNAPVDRDDVIGVINAIGTQATLDQDLLAGHACGALTKKRTILAQRATFSPQEQENVAAAYITLVTVSQDFTAALVEKHQTIVIHNAAHQSGEALTSTFNVLNALTDSIMTTVPTQTGVMRRQKGLLDLLDYG